MHSNARGKIANVAMTAAATEYSYTFPEGTIAFEIKLRSLNAILQIAFGEGESNTNFFTIAYSDALKMDAKVGGSTIFFQSPSSLQVAEIKTWV